MIKNIRLLLEKYPLFLLLMPLFVVVHIEQEYHGLITYAFVYRDIIELFIAPVVILLIAYILLRDWRKSVAFCLALMIVFYFFTDVKDGLTAMKGMTFFGSYKFLLPLTAVIIIVVFISIARAGTTFRRLFLFIHLLLLLFILADVVMITLSNTKGIDRNSLTNTGKPCSDCIKPDIYYVIFDSYTSSYRLAGEFNYNNYRLDSFLAEKGFYQVRHSRSNYNFTPYSVGSTLNYDYLKGVQNIRKTFLRDYLPYIGMIRENAVVSRLEQEGYEIINHSIFNFRKHRSSVPPCDLWNISVLYKRHNILRKIEMEIGWNWRSEPAKPGANITDDYSRQRDRHDSLAIDHLYKTLDKANTKPRFVYAHVEIPHAPFSIDSSGNHHPVLLSPGVEQDKADYLSQLAYSTRKIEQVIERIFQKSKRPFVIILQGDHGFKYFDIKKKDYEFDNLNAIYFYNKDYRLLHDSMTNINTFPAIFNTFLGSQLEFKKDSTVFLPYQ